MTERHLLEQVEYYRLPFINGQLPTFEVIDEMHQIFKKLLENPEDKQIVTHCHGGNRRTALGVASLANYFKARLTEQTKYPSTYSSLASPTKLDLTWGHPKLNPKKGKDIDDRVKLAQQFVQAFDKFATEMSKSDQDISFRDWLKEQGEQYKELQDELNRLSPDPSNKSPTLKRRS